MAKAFIPRPSRRLIAGLAIGLLAASAAEGIEWKPLVPGVSYAEIRTDPPDLDGEARLHVVRIDPARAPWVGGWADAVLARAGQPVYRAHARLLAAMLRAD